MILLTIIAFLTSIILIGQTSGGPDAYGYTWKNSNHSSNPPTYSWVDITSIGTEVAGLQDDNIVGPFSVPAGYQFYWYPITQFWIGSNGYISFNGTTLSSQFPSSIPLASGANDWVGMHVSDLNFAGTNNPAKCFYYATNDSLIISYIDVPYWNATLNYTGSNTFQVIFSSIDKSITFNYKNMNAGSTTLPIDNCIGIENVTGVLGLQSMIDAIPGNSFTIKYYYPSNVTYSVTDGGINWNNNEENGGYFVPVSNQAITLKSNIKNFGNQSIGSFSVTDTLYSGTNPVSNGSANISSLAVGDDTTITFSNAFIAQFAGTYRFASRLQGISGDLVAVNNRKVQEIISVNTNVPQYFLDYSDGVAEGTIGWNGGNGGVGIYIEPPIYPAKIDGTRYYIAANNTTSPKGFSAMVIDDDGPNGGPGTVLDSVYVPANSVQTGVYNTVPALDTTLYITNGGVYIAWYMGGDGISIGTDQTGIPSERTLEVLGSAWAPFRNKLTEDFLIGAMVSTPPFPDARFKIDTSMAPLISFTDMSTNQPFKWHWDFGYNNDTSNVQNPTYTYPANGTYTVCMKATNSLGTDSICKTVTIRNIGIEENNKYASVFIYPNPVKSEAFIDLPEALNGEDIQIDVLNVIGQEINLPYSILENRITVSTESLAAGVYLFRISSYNNSEIISVGKFQKE